MKRVLYFLLAATLLLGSSGLARDLTTISGDVFKNITVQSKDATGIQIMHDDGVAFLDFKNLSEADQKAFGFDLAAYADGWKQKFEAEKLRREQAELATLLAITRAQAQVAQANAALAQEASQPANQTALQVTTDSPGFIYGGYPFGGYPFWGYSTNVVPFGTVRNFGSYPSASFSGYNGTFGGSGGIRRH